MVLLSRVLEVLENLINHIKTEHASENEDFRTLHEIEALDIINTATSTVYFENHKDSIKKALKRDAPEENHNF